MKFVLLNDFKTTFKTQKKWLLLYYIVFITYMLFKYYVNQDLIDNTFVLESFGLLINGTNILKITVFTFHIIFYVYLAVSLFFCDLKEDKCNLFLRMDNKKWYVYKIISIFLMSILLELMAFLIFSLFSYLVSKKIFLFFFLKDVLFLFTCQVTIILGIIFTPCFLFLLLICYFVYFKEGNVLDINLYLKILYLFVSLILGVFLIRKNKCLIFEKC